jgi:hypothetical protein
MNYLFDTLCNKIKNISKKKLYYACILIIPLPLLYFGYKIMKNNSDKERSKENNECVNEETEETDGNIEELIFDDNFDDNFDDKLYNNFSDNNFSDNYCVDSINYLDDFNHDPEKCIICKYVKKY